MAYTIRYGPKWERRKTVRYWTMFQVMTAAVLLLTVAGVAQFWPEGRSVLESWLTPVEPNLLEAALQAMSDCIAAGEGWYIGAVTFCRMLLA